MAIDLFANEPKAPKDLFGAEPAVDPAAEAKAAADAEAKAVADAAAKAEAEKTAKAKAAADAAAKAEAEIKAKAKAEADAIDKLEAEEQALRDKRAQERAENAAKRATEPKKKQVSMTAASVQLSELDKILESLNRTHRRHTA